LKHENIGEVKVEERFESQRLGQTLAQSGGGIVVSSQLLVGKRKVQPSALVDAGFGHGLFEKSNGVLRPILAEELLSLVEGPRPHGRTQAAQSGNDRETTGSFHA
jgi:hypothetical protein